MGELNHGSPSPPRPHPSPTFTSGMPLAFLMGLANPSTVRGLEWLENRQPENGGIPLLHPSRVAYVGLRDLDVYERKILRRLRQEHGTFLSTMQEVDRFGIGRVMELALEALGVVGGEGRGGDEVASLHLSFDIDSVDPKVLTAWRTTELNPNRRSRLSRERQRENTQDIITVVTPFIYANAIYLKKYYKYISVTV